MNKLIKRFFVSLGVIAIATSSVLPGMSSSVVYASEITNAVTFDVKCYLNIDGKNQYIGIAQMSSAIKDGNESKYHILSDKHEVIAANMVNVPSLTKWVSADEQLIWTKLTFSLTANGGQPGYVAYAAKEKVNLVEEVVAEPLAETFSVKCYVEIDGTKKYVGLAEVSSTIKDGNESKYHIVSSDSDAIEKSIVVAPNFSKVISVDENIVWTKLAFSLTANGGQPGYVLYAEVKKEVFESSGDGLEAVVQVSTLTPTPTATSTPVPTATNTPVPTVMLVTATNLSVGAVVSEFDSAAYNAIKSIINSRTTTMVDISKYNLNANEVGEIAYALFDGECNSVIAPYESFYLMETRTSAGIVTKFCVKGTVKSGYTYESASAAMNNIANEVLAKMSPVMSDFEKALIINEYIVKKANYTKSTSSCATAWGILHDGSGLCEGYANAMIFLMNKAGIEARKVVAPNHAWVDAKLDGTWTLIDPTWDDTKMSSNGQHFYFGRSDASMVSIGHQRSYTVMQQEYLLEASYAAISTKYDNWFGHSVKGEMVYLDGYWFYAEGNNLVKSRIDGSEKQVLISESANVTVVKAENGMVTYKAGSTVKTTK